MVINDRFRFICVDVPESGVERLQAALCALPGDNPRWPARGNPHEPLWALRMAWPARRRPIDRILRRSPDGYYVFGFVRNPWDRVLALYRRLRAEHTVAEIALVRSFADFVRRAAAGEAWILALPAFRPQADCFRRDPHGPVAADFVGHRETLDTDLAQVAARLALPPSALADAGPADDPGDDYRDQYSGETASLVGDLFGEDSRLFGYRFDHRRPDVTGPGHPWRRHGRPGSAEPPPTPVPDPEPARGRA